MLSSSSPTRNFKALFSPLVEPEVVTLTPEIACATFVNSLKLIKVIIWLYLSSLMLREKRHSSKQRWGASKPGIQWESFGDLLEVKLQLQPAAVQLYFMLRWGKQDWRLAVRQNTVFFCSVWPGQYVIFTNNYKAKIFNLYNEMIPVKSADEAYPVIFKSVQNSCFSMPLVR